LRLLDLEPRWLDHAGHHVAIMFRCPHCRGIWLTCFFKAARELPEIPPDFPIEELRWSSGARLLFYEALIDLGHPDPAQGAYHDVVSCEKSKAWKRDSDNFATMTVSPSIDAGASGHWHGRIIAGQIR
jgi:hypothetical protein